MISFDGELGNGHQKAVNACRWTDNGEYLLTASDDRSCMLWKPNLSSVTPSHIKTYDGCHTYAIRDVCIFHDNSHFISAGDDRTVFLHDVYSGIVVRRINAHSAPTNAVALNNQSTVLLTASYDKTVRLWDLRSQSRDPLQVLSDFKDSVTSVSLTDHKVLAGCVDGVLRIYDLRKGVLHEDNLSGSDDIQYSAPIVSAKAIPSGTGRMDTVASLCLAPVHSAGKPGQATDSSMDNKQGKIIVSELASGKKIASINTGAGVNISVKTEIAMMLSSDGSVVLLAGGEDGAVRAWNSTGQLIQRLDVKSKDTVHKRSAVLTIATHPHKNMVVSGSHDGRVRIFSEKK